MSKTILFEVIHYSDGTFGRKRILEFFPTEGEHLFLSYSVGREHGPGIVRDGIGSPRMEIIGQPWKTTTDAREQRYGTWHIFPEPTPDEPDAKSHVGEFKKKYPNAEILSVAGFGDLTMNLWNTGFVNNPLTEEPRLLHLWDEPISSRIYTCLVKWNQGGYTISPVRFNRNLTGLNRRDPEVVLIDGKPVADQIEFAVFGQQVVRNGAVVDARQIVHQFSDIRHLLAIPNLNPKSNSPRYFFGAQRTDDVWLGEAQLLDDRNLRRAALSGSVELHRLYKGLGCSKQELESTLLQYGANRSNEPYSILEPGEWRWIPEDDNLVEIYLRRSIYPCTMFGVTQNGNLLSLAWEGKYNSEGGWTIEAAAKALTNHGAKDAILCDEGGDVMQRGLSLNKDFDLVNERAQIRAILIFANEKP
ncbi:MAG: hypothetical protein AABO57_00455 [Acidobacteriota bacterium]